VGGSQELWACLFEEGIGGIFQRAKRSQEVLLWGLAESGYRGQASGDGERSIRKEQKKKGEGKN